MKDENVIQYKNIPIHFDSKEEVWYAIVLGTQITAPKPSALKVKLAKFIEENILKLNVKVLATDTGATHVITGYNTNSRTLEVDSKNYVHSSRYSRTAYIEHSAKNSAMLKKYLSERKKFTTARDKFEKIEEKYQKEFERIAIHTDNFAEKCLKVQKRNSGDSQNEKTNC